MNTKLDKDQGGAPIGGNINEVLKKNSSTDFDYSWAPESGGSGTSLETSITQTHAFSVGQVIRMASSGLYVLAQADTAEHSEAVGIVTGVTGTTAFTYVSSAIRLASTVTGTEGSGLFLSPTVAGAITTTKPTTIGQFIRAVGTLLDSGNYIYFDIAALAEEITLAGGGVSGNVTVQDEFYGLGITATGTNAQVVGELEWRADDTQSATFPVIALDAEVGHSGIVRLNSTANIGASTMSLGEATLQPISNIMEDGSTYRFIIRPQSIDTGKLILLEVSPSLGTWTDDIRLIFTESTGNITFVTDDGTPETTNLGAYTLTNWYDISFIVNGLSVECYIGVNGATPTLVATHSTHIPASSIGAIAFYVSGSSWFDIDYFSMYDPTAHAQVNGVTGVGVYETKEVNLSSADILALWSTPKVLVPAQGVNTVILPVQYMISFTANTTPYANGNGLEIGFLGNLIISALPSSILTDGIDNLREIDPFSYANYMSGINQDLTLFQSATTPFINGDGTAKVFITYQTITL